MSEVILIVLTAIIAFFTYLVWLVYSRIAWLTGAMESHSTLLVRIEAARGIDDKPIEVVWWDPTIEPFPFKGAHGQVATLDRIYAGMPVKYRQIQRGIWRRLQELQAGPTGFGQQAARRLRAAADRGR
jgi:hypothetical protein